MYAVLGQRLPNGPDDGEQRRQREDERARTHTQRARYREDPLSDVAAKREGAGWHVSPSSAAPHHALGDPAVLERRQKRYALHVFAAGIHHHHGVDDAPAVRMTRAIRDNVCDLLRRKRVIGVERAYDVASTRGERRVPGRRLPAILLTQQLHTWVTARIMVGDRR